MAVHDPVCDGPAGATAGREADGVEARGDEVAAEAGRLAQDVAIVRA